MNCSVNTDLLIKYFSGLASPEEALCVDEWRRENTDNDIYFQELFTTWASENAYQSPDVDSLWKSFEHKTQSNVQHKPSRKWLKWMPYAAILVLALSIGLWQMNHKDKNTQTIVHTYQATQKENTFKDGAAFTLNENAVITALKDGQEEWYELKGTALFDFTKPFPQFKLHLPADIWLKDIGTKFLVEGDEMYAQVSVYEGAVEVWKEGGEAIVISKNEVLNYKPNLGFSKTNRKGSFDFKDYSLQKVCDTIGHYFNTKIALENQALANRLITIKGSDLDFKQVLEIISSTLEISYEAKTNDSIVFKTD